MAYCAWRYSLGLMFVGKASVDVHVDESGFHCEAYMPRVAGSPVSR